MRRWVTWVADHPWPTIGLVLLATLSLAWRLPSLRSEVSMASMLPKHHPYVQINEKIEREFGGRNLVVMAIVPKSGTVWRSEVLSRVKAVTDEVLDLPGVIRSNVTSLSAPSVRTFSDRNGRIEVEYLMREAPDTEEEIEQLRRRVDEVPLYRGLLVTEQGGAAMVIADFWPEVDEHRIAGAVADLSRRHSDDVTEVLWAGTPVVLDAISKEVVRTQWRFSISFVGIAGILYLTFGSFQGMIVPLTTAAFAVVWAVGLMAWIGAVLDGWSVMTPVLVLAVAAGHSAQILKRYYEEYERLGDNRGAVVESTTRIGLVMLAAGTTAALGFLSLLIFRVPSLRNFAIFTAWGIGAAMILELTFIPACRVLLRAPGRTGPVTAPSVLERALERTADWTSRATAPRVLIVWVGILGLAVAGISRIQVTASFESFIPESSPIRRNVDVVKQHFAGAIPMVIEIEGDEGALQSPALLAWIARLEEDLRGHPMVERILSVPDVLAYVNRVLGPDGEEVLPTERDLVAQLLFLTYSDPYERFLDRSYRRAAIWGYLRSDDTASIDSVIQQAKQFVAVNPAPDDATVLVAGGMGPAAVAVNEEVTSGKVRNVALIYLVIFTVGSLLFRSLAAGGLIVLPLLVSFISNLGILGWSGIDLDLTTSTVLAIGVGIGADYAIYLLSRIREEIRQGLSKEDALRRALLTSGKAVWFVAFAVGGGYLLLSPFSFLPLRLFGILVPTAMFIACASAVTLIPSILSLSAPRFMAFQPPEAPSRARAMGE